MIVTDVIVFVLDVLCYDLKCSGWVRFGISCAGKFHTSDLSFRIVFGWFWAFGDHFF